eukprot:2081473-Prymnesium_polylepis.1
MRIRSRSPAATPAASPAHSPLARSRLRFPPRKSQNEKPIFAQMNEHPAHAPRIESGVGLAKARHSSTCSVRFPLSALRCVPPDSPPRC